VGEWQGTVLSGFGVHLVYVYEHTVAPPPELDEVREAVMQNWHVIQREKFNAEFLEGLKQRYEIIIDEIPANRILARPAQSTKDPST
jgi:peptidyl-prolyl cis-trans isomerase C